MFSTLTLLVALVGHAALWIGCVNRLHAIGLRKLVKEAFTNVCFAVLFAVPLIVAWRWWSRGASLAGMVGTDSPLAIYLAACVPVAAFVGASRLWHLVGGERRGVVSQHSLRWVDFGADGGRDRLVSPGVARVISRLPGNQLLRLAVEEKTLRIPNLPSGLEGLKIAHLSDLHMSGRIHADYYAQTVDIANEWRPDIVALTGDLVENIASLESIELILGRLEARCGVYFVLGNHDAHGDSDELRRRLVDCGHVDVGGRWLDREVNGAKLRLAGNELPWFRPAADL
ncbi:MAG: metallophosphoesterase, partial [Planctomycetota bacterium]